MSPRPSARPLIPGEIMAQLITNGMAEDGRDPAPVLKLFNPVGPGRWLITEIAQDADSLFGLCDLDQGFPELGYVSLDELEAIKLPFGFRIERDPHFVGHMPLTQWASLAHRLGSIFAAEGAVRLLTSPPRGRSH
jgi:hypothetical protein